MKIIDDKIYTHEIDRWVDLDDFLKDVIEVISAKVGHEMNWKWIDQSAFQNLKEYKYPYISTYTKDKSELVKSILKDKGIDSVIDCYESDDGDDDYGHPITIKFWSVQIPELKIVTNLK